MGRFDALTQLDKQPVPSPPLPETSKPLQEIPLSEQNKKKPEILKARKEESLKGSDHENQQSGNPESLTSGNQAIPNARKPENRKVPKYSTQLEEALQIQVSVYAKMHRMKDYEVVKQAIEEYLQHHQ
jgi:hypothetical protein